MPVGRQRLRIQARVEGAESAAQLDEDLVGRLGLHVGALDDVGQPRPELTEERQQEEAQRGGAVELRCAAALFEERGLTCAECVHHAS